MPQREERRRRVRGLYVITDPGLQSPGTLPGRVLQAIRGGAAMVQYRDKGADAARRREEAGALAELCRRHGVLFIVNDDAALAAAVGADGVHVGRGDSAVADARAVVGPERLVGVSSYNDPERALHLQAEGADYVAFGAFFPSPTKPGAVRATPEMLRRIRPRLRVPVVAIGGITARNAAPVVAAGADALAVITDVFSAPDVEAAARAYASLFD
ncbi:thiamine phosphate synthase [Alkalilimnicola ehrlichii]|uniref:thiamine phosphate synthase n=1 Tax=Alkalilimnicola ehrlichii TaxID=351052 RepID=UPI003BA2CF3C